MRTGAKARAVEKEETSEAVKRAHERRDNQLHLFGFGEPPEDTVSFNQAADSPDECPPEANNVALEARAESDDWTAPIHCGSSSEGRKVAQDITRLIEKSHSAFGSWDKAFAEPLELMLYALTRQEAKYMSQVGRMKKEAVDVVAQVYARLFKALTHDYVIADILGDVYTQIASMSKSRVMGQYFTPFDVCEMMAVLQLGDVKAAIEQAQLENRRLTVMDPCVGSGAMLLASKKVIMQAAGLRGLDYFSFYGQDIDPICVNMCKVQMMLTDYRYMSNLMMTVAYEAQAKMKR